MRSTILVVDAGSARRDSSRRFLALDDDDDGTPGPPPPSAAPPPWYHTPNACSGPDEDDPPRPKRGRPHAEEEEEEEGGSCGSDAGTRTDPAAPSPSSSRDATAALSEASDSASDTPPAPGAPSRTAPTAAGLAAPLPCWTRALRMSETVLWPRPFIDTSSSRTPHVPASLPLTIASRSASHPSFPNALRRKSTRSIVGDASSARAISHTPRSRRPQLAKSRSVTLRLRRSASPRTRASHDARSPPQRPPAGPMPCDRSTRRLTRH
mmetsp:Transcript_25009/g.99384  ORF Transcript_25009/g.99384 Transcript_25009/m.99384 type:complete len:266 (+) Transcript_25009:1833-2630(+)